MICIIDLCEGRGSEDGLDLNSEKCTIELLEAGTYLLSDGKGLPLASAPDPEKLSSWAFKLGARSVAHRYNGSASCTARTPAAAALHHAGGTKVGEATDRTGEKVETWRCADCGREWTA